MANYVPITGLYSRKDFTFHSKKLGEGAKKLVYLTKDKKFVVAIYKNDLDALAIDRLRDIVDRYRKNIYGNPGKDYWHKIFAWPIDIVKTSKGKWGIVMPMMPDSFRFSKGFLAGEEKKGNWFVNKNLKMVEKEERGNWSKFLNMSLHLSRSIRLLHASGLSHSDLSFNNIITDPNSGFVHVLDLDDLVVPGKYPPGVYGTHPFIAPEVVRTMNDGDKKMLPCAETDLYALSVMIYMFLFKRHPLEGKKVWDNDPAMDERMQKGENALFIEDSKKGENRIKDKKENFPWTDTDRLPYTISGPFLAPLFRKAFEEGLHNPSARTLASEWESALIRTLDLLVKCENNKCEQKWFVFNKAGRCPFCGEKLADQWPVVNLHHYDEKRKEFVFANRQIIPYNGKKLHAWHWNSSISLNEKLDAGQLKSGAYFQFHNKQWYLVNTAINDISIMVDNKKAPEGKDYFIIDDKLELQLGKRKTSRKISFKIIKL